MKNIILLIFVFTCGMSFSQDFKKIEKKFSIQKCAESDYLIVSRKGKSGIYNKKSQEFSIPLSESQFIYMDKFQILFEFTLTNKVVARDLFSKDFPNASLTSTADNFMMINQEIYLEDKLGDYHFNRGVLKTNNFEIDKIETIKDSMAILSDSVIAIPSHIHYSFGVEKKGGFVIITDLRDDSYDINPTPISSIEYPNEDSIDVNGYVLYLPNDKGHQNSGVYDLTNNKWAITPQYFSILLMNDYIFCSNLDKPEDGDDFSGNGTWDIFEIKEGELIEIKKNIKWVNDIPFSEIFESESLELTQKDSSLIQFTENGKKGLIQLSLFRDSGYFTEGELPLNSKSLKYDTLFPAKYDLIENISENLWGSKYLVLEENRVKYIDLFGEEDDQLTDIIASKKISIREYGTKGNDSPEFTYWIIDNSTFQYFGNDSLALISKVIEHPSERLMSRKSIEILNDSLILLEHWVKQGTYWEPAYNYEYDYTYNEEGEQLYYRPDPGEFKSGIYNLKSGEWLYDREYAWIYQAAENFQIARPELDSTGFYTTYLFAVEDFKGNVIEREIEAGDLKMKFINRLPKYKADTLYSFLGQVNTYIAYFETDDKMGLFYQMYPEIIIDPIDYVYFNSSFDFYCSFDGDHCQLNMVGFDSLISLKNLNQLNILPAENIPPNGGDLYIQIEDKNNHQIIHVEDEKDHVSLPFTKEDFQIYYSQEIKNAKWNFAINKINDSLIYVEDWLADEKIEDIYPLESIEYPGEDSLSIDLQKPVYPPLEGGYSRSGIYNFKTGKWHKPKIYHKIEIIKNNLLLHQVVRNGDGLIDHFEYKLIDLNQNELWWGTSLEKIPPELK